MLTGRMPTTLGVCTVLASFVILAASEAAICPLYPCGAVEIRYPFWVSGDDTSGAHCGYPSLGLECRRGTPVLRLPSGDYAVTSIRYGTSAAERTVSVFDIAATNTTCPHVAGRNIALPSGSPPPLSLSRRNANISFTLDCSFKGIGYEPIPCLQHGKNKSYFFRNGIVPSDAIEHDLCQQVVTMPVLSPVDDPILALRGGFELIWTPAVGEQCHDCEKAGGFCGELGGVFNCFSSTTQSRGGRQCKKFTTRAIVFFYGTCGILLLGFIALGLIYMGRKQAED